MKEQVTEKRPYEAPQLTVVCFKTERGFAGSGDLSQTLGLFEMTEYGRGDQNIEDRGTATEWSW